MTLAEKILVSCCCALGFFAVGDLIAAPPPSRSPPAFFETVRQEARALSEKDYQKPASPNLPEFLTGLDYNAYQAIHYRPDKTLWHSESSRIQIRFFHPGYLYREPVRINVVENGEIREQHFSPALFDYANVKLSQPVPDNLFFTGLCVLYPLNEPSRMDEVAVFLGSCYFRLLGAHQSFGASARGLAINTAEPGGEEFPRFTQFWIEKPGVKADSIRLYALLESPSLTGAYEFFIRPGENTVAEIQASLFFRSPVKKLGLAALTSMFFFGENRTMYLPDFRPEVHDSDGLSLNNGGKQWLWRPLSNPPKVHRLSSFAAPIGFGLMQRDRDFDHYQDLVANFESRPSLWVKPGGQWPAGRVELVEIPSSEERNDNIVAYWVPDQKIEAQQELNFQYTLQTCRSVPDQQADGGWRVSQTRVEPREKNRTRYFVDFADGAAVPNQPPIGVKVEAPKSKIENVVLMPNEPTGGWRAFFDITPDGDDPVEARLWLHRTNSAISEVWVYRTPKP